MQMRGQFTLYLDQYGNRFFARTIAELQKKVGGGRISKMYLDKSDGTTVHCGYVVGAQWCTAYRPVENPA
jgi:hypothetical protein